MNVKILKELGFSEDTFSEVLVVTKYSPDTWNCAPMGVKLKGDILYFYVYKDTKTYKAIKYFPYFTLNIVYDPEIFLCCVTKNCDFDFLENAKNFNVPHIFNADAYVECHLNRLHELKDKAEVLCDPLNIIVKRSHPRTFNRAFPAVVESLVYLTKLKPYANLDRFDDIRKLYERILICRDVVYHSTTDDRYRGVINRIVSYAMKILSDILE